MRPELSAKLSSFFYALQTSQVQHTIPANFFSVKCVRFFISTESELFSKDIPTASEDCRRFQKTSEDCQRFPATSEDNQR